VTTEHSLAPGQRAGYWDTVYDTKGEDGVSWYQAEPTVTLELFEGAQVAHDRSIIDVGGGASVVVDHLMTGGYTDVTVLDVSKVALEDAKVRLGTTSQRVTWLHRDIFDWVPERQFDVWHDRAVFHFLIEEQERRDYVRTLLDGVNAGSCVIIATFDVDGPTHCSGLPVVRYGGPELAGIFAPHLELVTSRRQEHVTPAGVVQPFTWVMLQRR